MVSEVHVQINLGNAQEWSGFLHTLPYLRYGNQIIVEVLAQGKHILNVDGAEGQKLGNLFIGVATPSISFAP